MWCSGYSQLSHGFKAKVCHANALFGIIMIIICVMYTTVVNNTYMYAPAGICHLMQCISTKLSSFHEFWLGYAYKVNSIILMCMSFCCDISQTHKVVVTH